MSRKDRSGREPATGKPRPTLEGLQIPSVRSSGNCVNTGKRLSGDAPQKMP